MTEVKLWLAFSMIGVLVAVIAFCMIEVEDMLIEVKGEVF